MDSYRIDGHKLMLHPERVARWLASEGKDNYIGIYPIYAEISLSGICNHHCTFCALDFAKDYKNPHLKKEVLDKLIPEMAKLGVKSIMYGGEGEPLMHPKAAEIINFTGEWGIDVALTSNGVLLTEEITDKILSLPPFPFLGNTLKWIKISINAGSPDTYAKIHKAPKGDFSKVIKNIKYLIERKKALNHPVTVGIQTLLLPENRDEIKVIANIAKDIGVDYFVVKPYSYHPKSQIIKYKNIKYHEDSIIFLQWSLFSLDSEDFEVIFRNQAFKGWDQQGKDRCYKRCLALPFWTYISSKGKVWGCSTGLEDEKFYYGNVYVSSFEEIWKGNLRQRSLKWVENTLDINQYCRVNCRMNEINKYLWELKNPPKHINFI